MWFIWVTFWQSPHGYFDYIGEAINVVNNFKFDKVILNCGPYNDLEIELIKVLYNLKDIKVYRTDQDGSFMFKNINNKLKIETCSP